MERDELTGILVYCDAGAVFGVIAALLLCRSREPFKQTLIWSGIGAPAAVLFAAAIMGAVEFARRVGFDPLKAIAAAVGIFLFGVYLLPVFCVISGLPAIITGLAAQAQLQRLRRKNVRLRFGLKTLLLIAAIVPPFVSFLYFEPAMGVITVSALIGTFVAVNIAVAAVALD